MAQTDMENVVTSQAEEYLEAVCRLCDRGESATLTGLARELNVAPPSVIGMLRRLEEQALVTYRKQTGVILTDRGQQCAAALRRRHRLAELMLTRLVGMPWTRAHAVACRFEHVIDAEVESYLLQALGYPEACPHGNPLDSGAPAYFQPLAEIAVGQVVILRRIIDETEPLLNYLERLHLYPGARVTVCEVTPFNGPLAIEVAGEHHALSRAVAASLLVEAGEEHL